MSGFSIAIQPTIGAKGLLFRFRVRNAGSAADEVALIQDVKVEKVGEQEVACEIKSAGDIPLTEWNYNDAPEGFKKVTCKPLDSGEYDVIAFGSHGVGEVHLNVAANGTVTPAQ